MRPKYQITACYDPKLKAWAACLLIGGKNNGCIAHGRTADEAITRAQRFYPDYPIA